MRAPTKTTIFHAAVGVRGTEARDHYDHPDRYGLVGETSEEVLAKVAAFYGWESPAVLDDYLTSVGLS